MKNVLVTGGAGFIGSHVVDAIVEAGHQATVLDRGVRPHRADVAFVDVDLLNFPSLLDAAKGQDFMFHLAATSNVNHVQRAPVFSTQQNVMGTCNVLDAARLAGVGCVVLASTVWVGNAATSNGDSRDNLEGTDKRALSDPADRGCRIHLGIQILSACRRPRNCCDMPNFDSRAGCAISP